MGIFSDAVDSFIGGNPLGSLLDYGLGESSAQRAHQRNLDAYGQRYQLMMEDMRKAGLNPILAGELGAGSIPGSPINPNSAVAANSSNMGLQSSHTDVNKTLENINNKKRELMDIDARIKSGQANFWDLSSEITTQVKEVVVDLKKIVKDVGNTVENANPIQMAIDTGEDVVKKIIQVGSNTAKTVTGGDEHLKKTWLKFLNFIQLITEGKNYGSD